MAEDGRPVVLVVDDDAFVRRPLELFLRDEGFEPITAETGDECVERVRSERPAVIVMDVMMPGMDGFATCEALKSDPESRSIPVILLTGRGEREDQIRSREVGAVRLVTKPYSPGALIDDLRRLIDSPVGPRGSA